YTFGTVDRDPRGRVITVAYLGLVDRAACKLNAGTDAAKAQWFDVNELPSLAFDHAEIVHLALTRLLAKVHYEPVAFHLLPKEFTLSQLQELYETFYRRPLVSPNFRRSVTRMDLLKAVGEQQGVAHRPAKFFRYDEKAYQRMLRRGLNFIL